VVVASDALGGPRVIHKDIGRALQVDPQPSASGQLGEDAAPSSEYSVSVAPEKQSLDASKEGEPILWSREVPFSSCKPNILEQG
jgi:hypothetical protein